jgi:CheY-like chemotaxis protein
LLADDSVTIQRVIELTFADEDVHVVAVGDGDQAIALMDRMPPDIVLADIGMPGRNGYEVARHVKETPRLAHIPVMLLTGAFEPIDQDRANAVGCDGVLNKPFEPQLVIGRVKELLARLKPVSGEPPAPAPARVDAGPPVGAVPLPARDQAPATHAAPASPEDAGSVDAYFDQLDRAFAALSSGLEAARVHPPAPAPSLPDLPLSFASPRADFDRTAGPLSAPQAPTTLPPLSDAFVALLAAEPEVVPESAPVWPGTAAPSVEGPGAPGAHDALVEQVTAQVLARLSDRVVRETVAEIVSAVAERVVREEIERIKSHIK